MPDSTFKVGSYVQAKFLENGRYQWFDAKVLTYYPDGSYRVQFHDKDVEILSEDALRSVPEISTKAWSRTAYESMATINEKFSLQWNVNKCPYGENFICDNQHFLCAHLQNMATALRCGMQDVIFREIRPLQDVVRQLDVRHVQPLLTDPPPPLLPFPLTLPPPQARAAPSH